MLLQLPTVNTRRKEFRAESRTEALCVGAGGLQRVRHSQELTLGAQFLYVLISRKAPNPSW